MPYLAVTDLSSDVIERFWSLIDITDDFLSCWLWKGCVNSQGYGSFSIKGRIFKATHITLELTGKRRPKSPNNFALHGDCSNPTCCNPSHLRWGNAKENAADKIRLGRLRVGKGDRHGARLHPETRPRGTKHHSFTNPETVVKGSGHGMAVLNENIIPKIRNDTRTLREIGEEYGVHLSTIWLIKKRKKWGHVP